MLSTSKPKPAEFHVFDTTLRDGSQQEGLNLSVADKLAIAALIDELGVDFIEGGWPGANPNDTAFFAAMADGAQTLKHAELVSFGFTRRVGMKAADDPLTAALRESRAPVACIVAKSHDRHVEQALRTTLAENLAMITRHRAAPAVRGPAGLRRLRALLQRLPGEPGVRAGGRPDRRRGRRRGRGALRHQRRHAAPLGRRDRHRHQRDRGPAGHPRPQRHRLRGRQHPGGGRRRSHARAGNRERVRGAYRQRRADLGRRQPGTEVRLAAASGWFVA